eukprot:COSAG01_NODE_35_length_34814_cov_128.883624_16_plen_225_part_00
MMTCWLRRLSPVASTSNHTAFGPSPRGLSGSARPTLEPSLSSTRTTWAMRRGTTCRCVLPTSWQCIGTPWLMRGCVHGAPPRNLQVLVEGVQMAREIVAQVRTMTSPAPRSCGAKAAAAIRPRRCSFFVQAPRAVLLVVPDVSPPHFRQAAFDGVRGEELLPGPGVRTPEQLRRWVREHVDTGYHPTSVSAPHRLLCRPATVVVVAAAAAAAADDRQSVLCAAC